MSNPEWNLAHVARHPDEGCDFGLTPEERELQKIMLAEFELNKQQAPISVLILRSDRPVHVAESSTQTHLNATPRVDSAEFARVHRAGFLDGRNEGFVEGKQAVRREIEAAADIAETTLDHLEAELRGAYNAVDELEWKRNKAREAVTQLRNLLG
jgi:hypothetical protein